MANFNTTMEDLLTPIRTSTLPRSAIGNTTDTNIPNLLPVQTNTLDEPIINAEGALTILKSSPSVSQFRKAVNYCLNGSKTANHGGFDIRSPSAFTSRVINTLITESVPNFWSIFINTSEYRKDKELLLKCLNTITGIGGLVATTRTLSAQIRIEGAQSSGIQRLKDVLNVLNCVLSGEQTALALWKQTFERLDSKVKRDITWKEIVGLLAGGKVIAVVAEAELLLRQHSLDVIEAETWLGNGKKYAAWLGRNIFTMMDSIDLSEDIAWMALRLFLSRSLSLGYVG